MGLSRSLFLYLLFFEALDIHYLNMYCHRFIYAETTSNSSVSHDRVHLRSSEHAAAMETTDILRNYRFRTSLWNIYNRLFCVHHTFEEMRKTSMCWTFIIYVICSSSPSFATGFMDIVLTELKIFLNYDNLCKVRGEVIKEEHFYSALDTIFPGSFGNL